jgi:hypothetical protein
MKKYGQTEDEVRDETQGEDKITSSLKRVCLLISFLLESFVDGVTVKVSKRPFL